MRLSFFAGIMAAALAVSGPVRAIDPHLPPDTQIYLALNLRQVIDSPLFKKHVLAHAQETIKSVEQVETALKELGVDPFKHLDRLIVASPGVGAADRGLGIVHGTFDLAKFKAHADKLKKADDASIKVHEVPLGAGAKHTVYEIAIPGRDQALYVALASNKVLLISPGKDYVVEAIKQARTGKPPVLKEKGVATLIDGLDAKLPLALALPGKAVWGVAGAGDLLKGVLDSIEAIGGGLSITEEIKLELAITVKEKDNAMTLRNQLDRGCKLLLGALALWGGDSPAMDFAYRLAKSLKVSGKGKVVSVSSMIKASSLRELFGKE